MHGSRDVLLRPLKKDRISSTKIIISKATTTESEVNAQEEASATTRLLEIESQISQEHFINLTFEAPDTYRPGVPFSGKVKTT